MANVTPGPLLFSMGHGKTGMRLNERAWEGGISRSSSSQPSNKCYLKTQSKFTQEFEAAVDQADYTDNVILTRYSRETAYPTNVALMGGVNWPDQVFKIALDHLSSPSLDRQLDLENLPC